MLSYSHAVWPAADPPGYHPADDQQLSEGQQQPANTGRKSSINILKLQEYGLELILNDFPSHMRGNHYHDHR